jgi:membrane-bound lytic murein transglycosylase MltF
MLAVLAFAGCGGDQPPADGDGGAPGTSADGATEAGATPRTTLDGLPPRIAALNKTFTGDFDAMRERRAIRVLVPYNHTQYFVDGAEQRGAAYDALQLFQKHINEKYKTKDLPIEVVILPATRERLLERLAEGQADIVVGALTITDDRKKMVDFSTSTIDGVKEVVVTGPAAPPSLASTDDLSGQEVWVRRSSSYRESLERLNRELEAKGKAPVVIRDANETLEDEDILEMVNAGLYGVTVVDDYLATFWAEIFPEIRPHPALTLREGAEFGWALRKGTPLLMAEVNEFVAANREGTLTGNVLLKKYLGTTKYARNAFEAQDLARFKELVGLFQKYADQYRFDWLLCAAQGYQESRLDQSVRSPVGAIGVMQVMPKTAKDPVVGIPNIDEIEPNIHAGIKYLRWVVDKYFNDPAIAPVDQALFAFASYNAGPNRIARIRGETAAAGLDPNKWFRNVELLVARQVGREPVQYVANIFKYYIAYTVIAEKLQREGGAPAKK